MGTAPPWRCGFEVWSDRRSGDWRGGEADPGYGSFEEGLCSSFAARRHRFSEVLVRSEAQTRGWAVEFCVVVARGGGTVYRL